MIWKEDANKNAAVFLDENQMIKLGDFGLSKALGAAGFANTYVGVRLIIRLVLELWNQDHRGRHLITCPPSSCRKSPRAKQFFFLKNKAPGSSIYASKRRLIFFFKKKNRASGHSFFFFFQKKI
jgi:hypothetical protein